jgi:hypothetical protein
MKAHNRVRRIEGEKAMKYILMMNCPKQGYESFGAWPKEAIHAHIGFMKNLNKELRAAG